MSNKEVSKAICVMLAVGLFTTLFTFFSLYNGEKRANATPVVQNSSGIESSTDWNDRKSKKINESFHQNVWWGQLVKVPIERAGSLSKQRKDAVKAYNGHLDEDYYNFTNPNNAKKPR